MNWIEIPSDLWSKPEFMALSPSATALWVTAACWAAHNNTFGTITDAFLKHYSGIEHPYKAARELVEAGLWEASGGDYTICGLYAYNSGQ